MKNLTYIFLKRSLDILVSFVGLTILSPIFIVVIICQLIIYKRNIFFNQKRVGFKGKIFRVFKFKTMNDKTDKNGHLLPDNQRVTKFGKFLRAFSLDELPQLFNILLGQMSVVGPRPQSIEVCLFMNKKQFLRHQIKPGLTGLSAINGRNEISWNKKIDLDLEYIIRRTILLDIKIIIITAFKVILRQNVFSGNNFSAISLGEELYLGKKITKEIYDSRFKIIKDVSNKPFLFEENLILTHEN